MLSLGIGEIQKNSAVFSNLTEAMQIVDKRKKRVVAMVYPVNRVSVIDKLAGKYRRRIKRSDLDFAQIKEAAMHAAMEEKYGLSS